MSQADRHYHDSHQNADFFSIPVRLHKRSSSRSSRSSSQSSLLSAYVQKLSTTSATAPVPGTVSAYGSFTTTPSASSWLRSYAFLNLPEVSISLSYERRQGKLPDRGFSSTYDYDSPDSSVAPDSPLSATRPSISRTSSSDSYIVEPFTKNSPVIITDPGPSTLPTDLGSNKLHPILEAVESASKLSSRTACSPCLKSGFDYPRCPRCKDMWCSRECRLQGGKRHVCTTRRV